MQLIAILRTLFSVPMTFKVAKLEIEKSSQLKAIFSF